MMAGCGCGASFEAGLWETMKWGALFGAKKGILKGSALGATQIGRASCRERV